ncbi:MAG: putative chromate transport protein [Alphaproteobacteria bacterium ADurb.Bin438]|nr:MAG: putative chromate transport protein [Alphaproteobacteria bacterium ADurb.Bin438]
MMPLFQNELVKKRQYITDEELIDLYSIGQCTPGIIAVNISTFIGYKMLGIIGGLFSTLGMISPSIIIISIIASFMKAFMDNEILNHAFAGIRVCVVALMLNIVYGLFRKSVTNKFTFTVFLMSLFLLFQFGVSPIFIVLLSAFTGFLSENVKKIRSNKAK